MPNITGVRARANSFKPVIMGNPVKWNASQYEFIQAPAENAWFAGAYGCGKTYALLWRGAKQAYKIPGGAGLVGTDTGPSFYRAIYPKLMDLWAGMIISESKKPVHKIVTRTCNPDKPFTWYIQPFLEWQKLGGDDISVVLGDEMNRCAMESHQALTPRLRHPASEKHYLSYASNNQGKDWCWRTFVEGNEDNTRPDVWWKTTSTLENLHNLPANFLDRFASFPEKWWRRYIYGEFLEFEGQCYDMLNRKVHLIPQLAEIPNWWVVTYAIDHGFNHPTVCTLKATDPHGNDIIFDEYYRRGVDPMENAEAIVRFLEPYKGHGRRGVYGCADPSMWNKHSGSDPMSDYAKVFSKAGIVPPMPAFKRGGPQSNIKTQGAYRVIARLKEQPGHEHINTHKSPGPSLYFTKNCIWTWKSMGVVSWDERPDGSERVKKVDGDDCADTIWYHCWNETRTPKQPGSHAPDVRPNLVKNQPPRRGMAAYNRGAPRDGVGVDKKPGVGVKSGQRNVMQSYSR